MNCFYHPDKPAIGVCKSCSKGLCQDCVTDLGHGLACKNKHEAEVNNLNMIITKNYKVFSSAHKNTLLAPLFYIFVGSVFSVYGYISRGGVTGLSFVLGTGFVVFGVIVFVRNRALFGKNA